MAAMYLQASYSGWILRLFGDFALIDPQGQPRILPNRKVEALLGVLAVHREFGILRDDLAEILWPNRPVENQRTNLRQAVSLLRKAVGDEALESSRSHVRLSSGLRLTCDYDQKELRKGPGFLPGHEGDWFDDIRLEDIDSPIVARPTGLASMADSYLETLQLLATVDARGMFAMMKSNYSLSRNVEYRNLGALLETAGRSEATFGWASYWYGTMLDDLNRCADPLRKALRFAKAVDDFDLASEACLELGKAYSRMGNLPRAEKICDIADHVARCSRSKIAKANAARLRGTHMMHWGDPVGGMKFLQEAEELTDDVFSRTQIQAVRAFFAASQGWYDEAAGLLKVPEKMGVKLGVNSATTLNSLTQAMLTISGGHLTESVAELERIRHDSYQRGIIQISVYAEEMLAKVYLMCGEKGLAHKQVASARQGRQKAQMIMTKIESTRIQLLA